MDILNICFKKNASLCIEINWLAIIILILLIVIIGKIIKHTVIYMGKKSIEIDEIELGIGDSHITLKYDKSDKDIAYKLWVELSTRKIGLEYDENNDVIIEVYNSWYEFFKITRELLKDMPSTKVIYAPELIELSLDILNMGLRPHLTKWQAKYRKWYEEIAQDNKNKSPQDIQKEYPEYGELIEDLKITNMKMIRYKKLMHNIAFEKGHF